MARLDPKLLYPLEHRGEEGQVEGVGPLTALTFVLRLEGPYRFERSRSVGAYLGLVPATARSGDEDPQKLISKEGDEMLSGSCWWAVPTTSLGPFGSDLRRHGEKIVSRGGKNAKKRAAVAVARKHSAKGTERAVASTTRRAATSALDKQCLLIEVRGKKSPPGIYIAPCELARVPGFYARR